MSARWHVINSLTTFRNQNALWRALGRVVGKELQSQIGGDG